MRSPGEGYRFVGPTSFVEVEIASQQQCWVRAADLAQSAGPALPATGERVAVIGCGTSWYVAQAYAAMREDAGAGETDAFAASETPAARGYDRVVAITRSGTTTEVLRALAQFSSTPTVAVTTSPARPAAKAASAAVVLDFADEESVVQTRFATSAIVLLRAALGLDVEAAIRDVDTAVNAPIPDALAGSEQFTFLGTRWTYGLALEAALKMREASGAWTEAYPAMEYRHGPVSVTRPNRTVWMFGTPPPDLAGDIQRTGGMFENSGLDPIADLVRVQRLAVRLAHSRGLDPDRPRNLTRSVILRSTAPSLAPAGVPDAHD